MFPVDFAFRVVRKYAPPDLGVLDPFAGRASSVYAAASLGRPATGIEINPVGWVYGAAKLRPAHKEDVVARLTEMVWISDSVESRYAISADSLKGFFHHCYSDRVLRFLTTCRRELDWERNSVDRTLMAFVLVYLHGKRSAALSNQLRDGKAMAPAYAVRWWRAKEMRPPTIDPLVFMTQRIEWRYSKGTPATRTGNVILGDSIKVLGTLSARVRRGTLKPFGLLFTSPPYMGVTNYYYDQWLRLWMLGGSTKPSMIEDPCARKFESPDGYRLLLESVFGSASETLAKSAAVYVRTDAREFTLETTLDVLRTYFPKKRLRQVRRPLHRRSQTALFGDKSKKPGEVDLILTA